MGLEWGIHISLFMDLLHILGNIIWWWHFQIHKIEILYLRETIYIPYLDSIINLFFFLNLSCIYSSINSSEYFLLNTSACMLTCIQYSLTVFFCWGNIYIKIHMKSKNHNCTLLYVYIKKCINLCNTKAHQDTELYHNQEIPPTLPRKTLAYLPWNNHCFYFFHNLFFFCYKFWYKGS